VVIEEGDPILFESLRAAGIPAEGKPEMYRFGELNVNRVRRILNGDTSPEAPPPKGKPPELCQGCSHRDVFEVLRDMDCIVSGDIGCYTLGVLPPFSAMDTCVCMGASIGVGLGMRHTLPPSRRCGWSASSAIPPSSIPASPASPRWSTTRPPRATWW
jgi:indolepyruvate ferredoxin oxidoreductase alpha subunit